MHALQISAFSPVRVWVFGALLVGLGLGCSSTPDEQVSPTLPVDTSSPTPFPTPMASSPQEPPPPSNPEPSHTLLMQESGTWVMSPTGGPYDAMSGTLLIEQLLDGKGDPICSLTFSLTGAKAGFQCPGCSYTYFIQHVLVEGDPEPCSGAELPQDGDSRVLGYSSEDRLIYYNYNDTGIWLPWYDASRLGDEVSFMWESSMGYAL